MDAHNMTMGFKKDGTQRKITTVDISVDTYDNYKSGFSNVSSAAWG